MIKRHLRTLPFLLLPLFLLHVTISCTSSEPEPVVEATSLFNKSLYRIVPIGDSGQRTFAQLDEAQKNWLADSTSEDAIIWYGRRLSYAGQYNEAIRIYSNGLIHHPDSYKLRRHRGHRYISIRKFNEAVVDLEEAAALTQGLPDEIEPDGLPNALNQPRSSDQTNIWYHLGLAHFLKGSFSKSATAFENCVRLSTNDDMRVAATDWLYMCYRRLGRQDRADRLLADIRPEMDIIENTSYHKRLLMYKGEIAADSLLEAAVNEQNSLDLLTQGFGVGHWYLVNGDQGRASRIFQLITMQDNWAAFGYIAAEAELKRMR
jgi:tetratricopeptide (TPR) repeat protein